MTDLQAWTITLNEYARNDPSYLKAQEKLKNAYQLLGGGNRWGESRRFAGRIAGSRLEAVDREKAQRNRTWKMVGQRHRRSVLAALKEVYPIPIVIKEVYPDIFSL
jgi:hypothetical protein